MHLFLFFPEILICVITNKQIMKRISINPRKDYKEKIEGLGFNFHSDYWKENAYYSFTSDEIELLEKATAECYDMYCSAVQWVIDNDLWELLHIPRNMVPAIIESWERDDLSLYGRFDFAFIEEDGKRVPKLLEFNADTPTSLLESSLIQWAWKDELFHDSDQFNSIHERLVNSWIDINQQYDSGRYHFACCRENVEDEENLQYLVSTAMEAELNTAEIEMEQLLWNEEDNCFYDPSGEKIETCFKLYPWEWLQIEAPEACKGDINWIEPLWKSVMSNKAILAILYRLFPESPYILRCKENSVGMSNYCKKPIYSREGANVTLVKDEQIIEESAGDYGEEGYIYQELAELPCFDGNYPLIGSWVIGGEPAGIGIRECKTKITDNMSEFIPHIIE